MPKYISKNGDWKLVGDEVKIVEQPEPEVSIEVNMEVEDGSLGYAELDINQDGVVDDKDATLASKVLNNAKKRGRPKKSR